MLMADMYEETSCWRADGGWRREDRDVKDNKTLGPQRRGAKPI